MERQQASTQGLKDNFAREIREWYQRSWLPATSSNFSFRSPEQGEFLFAVSRSAVDKSRFSAEDFMWVDADLEMRDPPRARPSAEALIHSALYQSRPEIQVVVHTHSVASCVLSRQERSSQVVFENYEILKAFDGVSSHETQILCPIFENTQDMRVFSKSLALELQQASSPITHGFLIRGHGLYTWGQSLDEAKRHLEAWEFLFECRLKERSLV